MRGTSKRNVQSQVGPSCSGEESFTDLGLQPAEAPKIGWQVLGSVSHVDIPIHERPCDASHHRNICIVNVPSQAFDDLGMLRSLRVEYIAMLVTNGVDQIELATAEASQSSSRPSLIIFVLRQRDLYRVAVADECVFRE